MRRRPGGDRRRRQLGRTGGDVPLAARRQLPAADPRRRPRQVDVALPDRRDRAPRAGRGDARTARSSSCRASTALEGARGRDTASRRAARARRARRCSCSSAPRRTPSGCAGSVAIDEHGFLLTGRDLHGEDLSRLRRATARSSSRRASPAIFAVGDVHSGSIKRVASAVGEGSMAVQLVHQRLSAS